MLGLIISSEIKFIHLQSRVKLLREHSCNTIVAFGDLSKMWQAGLFFMLEPDVS